MSPHRARRPLSLLVVACGALFVFLFLWAPPALAQKAVFLVRHAEKVDESQDAVLSAAGHARAQRLASLLRDAGVTALYATNLVRTQQTLRPLADRLKVEINKRHVADSTGLVAALREQHAQDIVVVAGHSTTLPEIARLLGHPRPITVAEGEYDSLFIVVPQKTGPPLLSRLRY